MTNLLFAAAAATMVFAVSPAFASAANDAEIGGYHLYPPVSACQSVKEQIVLPNGHVVYQTHHVCN